MGASPWRSCEGSIDWPHRGERTSKISHTHIHTSARASSCQTIISSVLCSSHTPQLKAEEVGHGRETLLGRRHRVRHVQ